ncbi:hypothetical protein LJC46_09005 [Desulfovibrio sp. OttesenSCG-928-G15]|nr:hypothetical protein [Desulfovibrio sp. OttesenSCG-928-G15]
MRGLQLYSACIAAVLVMTALGVHSAFAAGIDVKNEMELDIQAVYCVDDTGTTKQVTGALKAKSSVSVTPDKFPEYKCPRIAVQMADGSAWQFYHDPEPGASTEILFSMDKANPNGESSYPSLLIENSGESYVCPAGVPLAFLLQAMQFGLDEEKWKEAAAPKTGESENPGAYAISFAGVSWSLVGDGIVFSELVPDKKLAESANMVAAFSNPTLMAIFDGLKSMGATPLGMTFRHTEVALTKEGKTLLPDAELTTDTQTDESRWEAVLKFLELASGSAGGDLPRLIFGNEAIKFDLVLDLESGQATLTVNRREDAAFG